ncbi:MAG: DNA (cytosine-5-)-methyltransferase [Alphaproteobacteria bacterium]|nr:DNA (cytosine-5-)-methyltransferase [Alphaproteobacteria bacterium]
MRSVELFSGCGGLALGTARAGFEHVRMVEWNAEACATLAHNGIRGVEHARDWPLIRGDVRAIDWSEVGEPVDLVAGGPPCQPFSIGGKHQGNEDSRDMWPEAIRAVRALRPRAFLFENVRGLARPAFADYLAWIKAHLAVPRLVRRKGEDHAAHLARLSQSMGRADYDVIVLKVNAADYGAAQKRHRVVLAGVRGDLGLALAAPPPTHSRGRLLWDQWISGEYWARHGMAAPVGGPASAADRNMVARMRAGGERPTEAAWRTVRDAIAGLGEPTGSANHVFQDGARVYPGHTGSPLDEPAKALKAGDHGVPGGENMMVRADGSVRYFTVRETARLQGLPDEWSFPSSWTESMRQLGNAVPVELAQALGEWMARSLGRGTPARRAA